MQQKYYIEAFGVNGDRTPVVPNTDPTAVSYDQGWNFNYQRDLVTDPAALSPTRQQENDLMFAATQNIQNYQQFGTPEFITTSDNGGVAFPYGIGAMTRYSASGTAPFVTYINRVDNNTAIPGADETWVPLSNNAFRVHAGNPNLFFAGQSGQLSGLPTGFPPDMIWDTISQILWVCITTGNAGAAVWRPANGCTAPWLNGVPGNLSVPNWANQIELKWASGGGPGGNCQGSGTNIALTDASGSGGGAGGYGHAFYNVPFGGVLTFAIPSAAIPGHAGGVVTVGGLPGTCSATGGQPGNFQAVGSSAGGAGGVPTATGAVAVVSLETGADGSDGQSGSFVFAGNGADGPWGGGGRAGQSGGIAGHGTGAGGGGAYDSTLSGNIYSGGNGGIGGIKYRFIGTNVT